MFEFKELDLPGLLLITGQSFSDARGSFTETYDMRSFCAGSVRTMFVQDNQSTSRRGVIRGLHFQHTRPQAKLVRVIAGEVFDVAVDLRPDSPTYLKWTAVTLKGDTSRSLYIPEGFAHGFCALSESAVFAYKCSDYYCPEDEGGIRFDDPCLAISWPCTSPIVYEKSSKLPYLEDIICGY
jgi:dTDP-4-dehydrorhamnose 3,5-epimerase